MSGNRFGSTGRRNRAPLQGADTGGREASAAVGEADQKCRSDYIVSKRHRVLSGN